MKKIFEKQKTYFYIYFNSVTVLMYEIDLIISLAYGVRCNDLIRSKHIVQKIHKCIVGQSIYGLQIKLKSLHLNKRLHKRNVWF